jgi:predicted GIY-YIG superfamily endonuclease
MFSVPFVLYCGLTSDSKKRLAVFHRLAILNINLDYFTARLGLNLVHEFHGFDYADDCFRLNVTADLHKRIR